MKNVIKFRPRPETDEARYRGMEAAASAWPCLIVAGDKACDLMRVSSRSVPPPATVGVVGEEEPELLSVIVRPGVSAERAREILLNLAENIRLSGLPLSNPEAGPLGTGRGEPF